MKNTFKKYLGAKRLTDEEILLMAAEDSDSEFESKTKETKSNSLKDDKSGGDTPKRRGRPKRTDSAVSDEITHSNVSKKEKVQTQNEQIAKRRPGRPKKSEFEDSADADISIETISNEEQPEAKRRPGRPKKSEFEDSADADISIETISNEEQPEAKRRPGRPKRSDEIESASEVQKPTELSDWTNIIPQSVLERFIPEPNRYIFPDFQNEVQTSQPTEKRRPGRPKRSETSEQSIETAKPTQARVFDDSPSKAKAEQPIEKRRPGRPKRTEVSEVDKSEEKALPINVEKKETLGLFESEQVDFANENPSKRRRGRPKRTGFIPVDIPDAPEKVYSADEIDELPGDEPKTADSQNELEMPPKRRPGRPRKESDADADGDAEITGEESIYEKVKKMKKRRGRRSKKNPFVVVISKDENKAKPVSEEEKVTEKFSIKDAISSTFKKEPEPAPQQHPHAPKTIEPLTDVYTLSQNKTLRIEEKHNDFITKFINDVEKFLIHEMYVDRSSKIVLAVSGGVDSIVLLDIMALLADKYKFALFIAHYNHNLRGEESDKDEAFVKKAAESYNLPFYTAAGKVRQYAEKNATSIETAARFLRYSFLERTSRNLNVDFVATAHTSDDSAETFLMNLLRGSGLTGLSGIPYRRQFVKDVLLIRPFINFNKATIIKYAKLRNIKWREDETNMLQNYTRNRVRHDLIPKLANDYNPAIVEVINRTAKLLQGADRIIHGYVRNNLQNVVTDIQTDKFTIKLQIFQTFDRFIQGEMIQTALMKYLRVQLPSLKAIDRVVNLQDSDIGAKCEVTKTITAVRDRNTIVFSKRKFLSEVNTVIDKVGKFKAGNVVIVLKEVTKRSVDFNKNPNVEFFDFDEVPPAIFLRTWEEGDVFSPLGMNGTMKISDFLTNEKVAFVDRQNVLVLATKTEVVWVLGMRISEKFKVKDNTERVLKVEIRYSEK